jgi:hypothetical protein
MIVSEAELAEAGRNSKKATVLQRKGALWNERSSWLPHWREISQVQQPRLGRFLASDVNRGGREKMRHNHILDNTAIRASSTLAAGMMSGMTSPARPWFRLTLPDQDLADSSKVKGWLHDVNSQLLRIFAAGNTYRALHSCYEEMGLFGTWANFVKPHFDNVIHHQPLTIGEYALATNEDGKVDTLCREMRMTVRQAVREFGETNVSTTVKNLYDRGNFDAWVDIIHLVEPRESYDSRKGDNKNMPFMSCYIEPGKENPQQVLRESGFQNFPALCPRWNVTSTDVYGHSPGMECLGDVNQLQFNQRRKSQAIEYQTNPPIQVPNSMRGRHVDRLPGGVSYYDATSASAGVRSLYEVNLNLSHLQADIVDIRGRVRESYFADMFLMLANDTKGQMTATEVAERHEEKLLMLGPVLERLDNELLAPLIDMTFDRMAEVGMLTGYLEPPPELEGMELKVEFVSILAQAQRAVAAKGMDRLLSTVGNMAALWPEARMKINPMEVVDEYAELYGVNPEIVVDTATAMEQMQAQAQAAAQSQAAASAAGAVETAAKASTIDGDNLQSIMSGLQGYDVLSPGR